jgi:hypothetical protein
MRNIKMKYLFTIALFSVLIPLGCNQESEIILPDDPGSNHQLKLISLPLPSSGLTIESGHTVYKYINGYKGGNFYAEYSYQSNSGMIYQASYLVFEPGAFYSYENISKTFSTTGASMVFGPLMQFQGEVKFTYKVTGLDLSGLNPKTLDFVYIDATGNMYAIEYDNIAIDLNSGTLAVYGAELPHFSRYGFVN